jgi:hypothetical protein
MRFPVIVAMLFAATPALSGGLFTDGVVIQGTIDGSGQAVIDAAPPSKGAVEALSDWEKQLALPSPSTPTVALKSYEELLNSKTTQQMQLERTLEKQLGFPVSNICLTSAGACAVSYATRGSTCFCSTENAFELGVIQ